MVRFAIPSATNFKAVAPILIPLKIDDNQERKALIGANTVAIGGRRILKPPSQVAVAEKTPLANSTNFLKEPRAAEILPQIVFDLFFIFAQNSAIISFI